MAITSLMNASQLGQELPDVVEYRFQGRRFRKEYFSLSLVVYFEDQKRLFRHRERRAR